MIVTSHSDHLVRPWATNPPPNPATGESAILPMARMVRNEWMTTLFRGSHDSDNLTRETSQILDEYHSLMLKEPAVSTSYWSLIAAVMSLQPRVHASDPDNPKEVMVAGFIKDAIAAVDGGWPRVICSIAAGALIHGYSVNELVFDFPERGKWRDKLVLSDISPIDGRYIRFDLDPFKRVVGVRGLKANGGQVFGPDRFAIYSHQSLFSNPFGISQFRSAYRAAKMMESAIKLRVILLQNFTGPFLALKSGSATTRATGMTVLSEARALGYLVCDKDDDIQVLNLAAGSDSEFQSAMDDFRKEMYTGIRWGYLPFTEGQAGAELGNSEVQRSMTQLGEWKLATGIAEVIQQQIVKPLIRANVADLSVGFPLVSLGGQNKSDKKAQGDIFEQAKRLNVTLSKKQVQRALDVEEPNGPEDELKDPATPGMPGGNPFAGAMSKTGGGGGPPAAGPDRSPPPTDPNAPQPGGGGLDVDGDGQIDFTGVNPNIGSTSPTEMDKAALIAALDLQAKAAMSGHPGQFQRAIDALKGMVGNHPALMAVLGGPATDKFSWEPAATKTGGVKAVGHEEHEGQTLYGPRARAALAAHEKHEEVATQSRESRSKQLESKQKASGIASKILSNTANVADYHELIDHLPGLSVEELRSVRARIGGTFQNAKRREGMVTALVGHVSKASQDIPQGWEEFEANKEKQKAGKGKASDGKKASKPAPSFGEQFAAAHGSGDQLAMHDMIAGALGGEHGAETQEKVTDAFERNQQGKGGLKGKNAAVLAAVGSDGKTSEAVREEGLAAGDRESRQKEAHKATKTIPPDDHDKERHDAAEAHRDRMAKWASDKPDDQAAQDALDRAQTRLEAAKASTAASTEGDVPLIELKEKRKKAGMGNSLSSIIANSGGIDPESIKKFFGGVREAGQYGLPFSMFKKGGRDIEELAQELHSEGHIVIPDQGNDPSAMRVDGSQHLIDEIAKKSKSLLMDKTKEYDKTLENHYRLEHEAREAGHDERSLKEATRLGQAAGASTPSESLDRQAYSDFDPRIDGHGEAPVHQDAEEVNERPLTDEEEKAQAERTSTLDPHDDPFSEHFQEGRDTPKAAGTDDDPIPLTLSVADDAKPAGTRSGSTDQADIFGNVKKGFKAAKAGQQLGFGEVVREMPIQKADEWAASNGQTIDERGSAGRFRVGDQWHQVGRAEDGYPVLPIKGPKDDAYNDAAPSPKTQESIESTSTLLESNNAERNGPEPAAGKRSDLPVDGENRVGSSVGADATPEPGPTPFKPRIVTARGEHTQTGNPDLLSKSVKTHLGTEQLQGASLAVDAMQKHGGFLNNDGTGVGKTRQQLAVAKTFADQGKKVLIISPKQVTKADFKKGTIDGSFKNDSATMGVPLKLTKGEEPLTAGQVHISTYDNIGKLKNQIDGNTVVLYDESHYMKNPTSARAKHGAEIDAKAHSVMYSTATPGDKALHIGHLSRAGVFGTAGKTKTLQKLGMELHDQHIGGGQTRKVWRVSPGVKHEEVARRLSGLFDQMTKEGRMVKRELSLDGVNFNTDHVQLTPDQHQEMQKVYGDVLERTDGNKAVALMAARMHQEHMKIPHTVAQIQRDLAAGRSPIIFAGRVNDVGMEDDHEDHEANEVKEALDKTGHSSQGTIPAMKAALIAAGIPESQIAELHGNAKEKPEKAMERFQNGQAKIMLATIQSGGTGVNLDDTKGDRPRSVHIMTPPFSANDMSQAIGRAHRLNTKSGTNIHAVLSDSNIDAWNAGILHDKFRSLGAISGGQIAKGQQLLGNAPTHEQPDHEPFDWGSSLTDNRHYFDTPAYHNELIKSFGGERVRKGGDFTTQFPSEDHLKRYKEAASKRDAEHRAKQEATKAKGPQHHAGKSHSFTQLKNGNWGARIVGDANEGDTAVLTKRDGSQKNVKLGRVVYRGNGVTLAEVGNSNAVPEQKRLPVSPQPGGLLPRETFADPTFREDQHPRDKAGEFIDKSAIAAAKSDPAKSAASLKTVSPDDRKKLESLISGGDKGKTTATTKNPSETLMPESESPASPKEWKAARAMAESKIASAPVPTKKQYVKVNAKLNAWKRAAKQARANGERVPKLREYYDARGGSAAHKKRAERIFNAHGGEKGYVVCHGTGRKMHWTDDTEKNPNGYPKFEQGKIFVAAQGGDYQDQNVLPEHPSYNRIRGNAPLRPENIPSARIDRKTGDSSGAGLVGVTPDSQALETAKRWLDSAPVELSNDLKNRYNQEMASVLTRMPSGFRKRAEAALGAPSGQVAFHPNPEAVESECQRHTGKKERGVVGFVRHLPGGDAVEMHVDGGPDAIQTYAHELGHAADTGHFYSGRGGWEDAWKDEIKKTMKNGKPPLSEYAKTSASEGFAELHAAIVLRGVKACEKKHPRCVALLRGWGLL